jgi:hypothetical protein
MHQRLDKKVSDLVETVTKERATEASGHVQQTCAAASAAALVEAELALISAEEELTAIQDGLALRRRLLLGSSIIPRSRLRQPRL